MSTRYRVTLGPDGADLTTDGARAFAFDARGFAHLQTTRAFAVDAVGRRRELALRVEGNGRVRTLTASLATEGLTYPILVDPVGGSLPSMGAISVSPTTASTTRSPPTTSVPTPNLRVLRSTRSSVRFTGIV